MAEAAPSRSRRFLAAGGGIVLVGITAFAVSFGAAFVGSRNAPATPEKLAAELEGRPEFQHTFAAIKASYPADYQAFLVRVAAAGDRDGQRGAEREAFIFTRQFMTSKFDRMASAPAEDLHAIAREYAAVARVLQQSDVPLCAQWATVGLSPDSRPVPAVADRMNRVVAMQIRAARAGESGKDARPRTVSQTDGEAFMRAVQRIDAPSSILIDNPAALDAASPERQCAAGVAIYEAAASLPTESAANVIVELLRASFGASAPVPRL